MSHHTLKGHTTPLLPPPTTTDAGLLPNRFILGPLLGIFPVVPLGFHDRQRALQLRQILHDVGESQAFRRYSYPPEHYIASSDPAQQKRLGCSVSSFNQGLWKHHRYGIVYKGRLAKFSTPPLL